MVQCVHVFPGATPIPTSPCAWRAALIAASVLAAVRCGGDGGPGPSPMPPPPPPLQASATLAGAGDIAMCGSPGTAATARLLDNISGTVFTAGDNAYPSGRADDFRNCYDPTWGRHKSRTRPSPGNHEYETPGAVPYFEYFGTSAGQSGSGFYTYRAGSWAVYSLNSNVSMGGASAQATWLRDELGSEPAGCSIAYWHHPLFSSGPNGGHPVSRDLWRLLYDAGVDVIINGHDHLYERFAPQDPDGRLDTSRGIRQFTVGTGGADLYAVRRTQTNSERISSEFGVLKLTLETTSYSWEFIATDGRVRDSGTAACH